MMRRVARSAMLAGGLLLLSAGLAAQPPPVAAEPAPPVGLLVPGGDLGDAAPPTGAESWYGLYHAATGGFELRRATLRLGKITHCGATVPGLIATDPPGAFIVVSGLGAVREGPAATAFFGHRFLRPGESLEVRLRDAAPARLSARADSVVQADDGPQFLRYALGLAPAGPGAADVFYRASFGGDVLPEVVWVGDLDQDGRPDVLVRVPAAGYSTELRLFLSSFAPAPAQVKLVARHYEAGC